MSADSTSLGDDAADAVDDRVGELEDQLRRAHADFENLRKRFEREVGRERASERARVAAAWLPVVDDLDRALDHADADPESVRAGVQSIRDQAVDILGRLGFTRLDSVGESFDPVRHEALGSVGTDSAPGLVAAVLRPGYGDGDEVLRPAGVMVSRARD